MVTEVTSFTRKVLTMTDKTATPSCGPVEFPYQKTFNAIADAVRVEAGGAIGISVAAFQKSFNEATPAPPTAAPETKGEVTQEDWGAATEACRSFARTSGTWYPDPVNNGHWLIKLLARHRTTAISTLQAEAARLRESRAAWEKVAREAQADYEAAEAQVRELREVMSIAKEALVALADGEGCPCEIAQQTLAALSPKEPSDDRS